MRKLERKMLFRDRTGSTILDYYEDAVGNLLIEAHNGTQSAHSSVTIIPRSQLDEEQMRLLLNKGFSNTLSK
ncbi:hypothetical protein WKH56_09485 [Priestia sp. SB1]|uniref:hypothetical protein n=1 Tax=Priestia TaxID=2800373 RepID=UPI001DD0EEFE|nr:hypothetical protein [Priestia megaterium]